MIICDNSFEEKIYIPKVIRKFPHKKYNKKKPLLNNYNYNKFLIVDNYSNNHNKSKYNFGDITIEEINKDFSLLDLKTDEEKCFDELNNIISKYNNNIYESEYKNINKIKRPKNKLKNIINNQKKDKISFEKIINNKL